MSVREGNATVEEAGPPRRWLWRLIAGRAFAAALLLGVSTLWAGGPASAAQETHRLGGVLPLAGAVLALSAAYALLLWFSRVPLRAQAGVQFALDALLVTWRRRWVGRTAVTA
jgi:hypothetical protein